jgi:hypothetical protein
MHSLKQLENLYAKIIVITISRLIDAKSYSINIKLANTIFPLSKIIRNLGFN